MNLVLFFFNKGISCFENTKAAFAAAFIIIKYFKLFEKMEKQVETFLLSGLFPVPLPFPLPLPLPLPLPFPLPLPLPFPLPFPFKLPAFFVTCRRLPPTCI
jgi:hypothetical protein